MHFYNDNDAKVAAWLGELVACGHLPPGDINTTSINDLATHDLTPYTQCHFFAGIGGWPLALRLAGWPDDQPVWTGSCPCQPFSVAGRGLGDADPRHLWPAFLALITLHRPPVIFGEQVAGKAGRLWLAGIRTDLEALGYAVAAADLCAAGVGAPHIRQRVYWVAHRHPSNVVKRTPPFKSPESTRPSPRNVWSRFESRTSFDGFTRRCPPSTPLLAYGIPFPVDAVSAYGNAIVPPLAAEFIIASVEAINDARCRCTPGVGIQLTSP